MKQKVTLKDVAQAANVSLSTVSMILNNRIDASFSEETTEKVLQAVEAVGYIRKAPRTQHHQIDAKTIAVLCPNVLNPYYSTIVQSIEQAAAYENYDVCTYSTYRDAEHEARILHSIENSGISGIIYAMIPSALSVAERVTLPIILLGDKDESLHFDMVQTDNLAAGYLMAEHLLGLGHKNIAYLSTTLTRTNLARVLRLEGLKKACADANNGAQVLVYKTDVKPEQERNNLFLEHSIGFELCELCRAKHPEVTAFVGINDMVAYGIMDSLLQSGYRIPKDFSVAGFDNNFPSSLRNISLTSTEQYMAERGHKAFSLLHAKIEAQKNPIAFSDFVTRMEFKHHLIQRNSTGTVRSTPYPIRHK